MDSQDMDMPAPAHSPNAVTAGRLLIGLTGFATVVATALLVGNPGALWAIFVVLWAVKEVDDTMELSPILYGLGTALFYVVLGVVAVALSNVGVLWAMLLVNWLVNAMAGVVDE